MAKERVVLLRMVCSQRGEDVSDFVRRAVLRELAALSYLSEVEKKALGVPARAERLEPDVEGVP